MKKQMTKRNYVSLLLGMLFLGINHSGLAQSPQDNWYLEQTWIKTGGGYTATNGGLSAPYGVAIGPDGRIYVADEGYKRIQVYLVDGTYSFSITNAAGQNFINPRGMITDISGNLYVADAGRNRVFVFNSNGGYIRTIGTTNGTGDGQLSSPVDVAVGPDNEVFVLENGNSRVSVFGTDGVFKRKWGSSGTLAGMLSNPLSLAVSTAGDVHICERSTNPDVCDTKTFDGFGKWKKTIGTSTWRGWGPPNYYFRIGGASIRLDPGGFPTIVRSYYQLWSSGGGYYDDSPDLLGFTKDGTSFTIVSTTGTGPYGNSGVLLTQCHAVGRDGTIVFCAGSKLLVYRMVLRDQCVLPRNAIPVPEVIRMVQRSSSPLVDIDYQVSDMDSANVTVGALIFSSSSSAPSLNACIRSPSWVEGTSTNLGLNIAANQIRRLTWNAGADWSTNLGNFRVAILAKDSRTNLLDIHYLNLPAGNGMTNSLKISRSPLVANDFMQVWWWLLATGDPGITVASNQIIGVSAPYAGLQLCTNTTTTANGRSYIYGKMNVREATTNEVQWAKQGNMPSGSSPNQWTPGRQVSGRPSKVNEWGFDTGSWDASTCKWVVPLP